MTEAPTKIKRIKSTVQDYHDVEWADTEGVNPIIDNAIVNDDLTLTIEFQEKKYTVRSPDRRITKKLKALQKKEDITFEEGILADELQEQMVEDMIEGLSIDNHPQRISELEYDQLATLCWHYFDFSKKKSIAQASDSIS